MEKTLKVLNGLKKNHIIEKYAIGGGIATLFYTEPILTYDMDVFILLPTTKNKLVLLSPIYAYLREKGYREHKEHIIIEGIPVQFIPAYNPLIEEAVEKAREVKYKLIPTRVFRPEYLFAIMLQTDRPKDRARMALFIEETKINQGELNKIIKRHQLNKKWSLFREQVYGK